MCKCCFVFVCLSSVLFQIIHYIYLRFTLILLAVGVSRILLCLFMYCTEVQVKGKKLQESKIETLRREFSFHCLSKLTPTSASSSLAAIVLVDQTQTLSTPHNLTLAMR